MPKVFSLPIFTKEFRRSVPSVILWFLISGGLLVLALYSFSAAAQTDFSDRLQETLSAFPEELLAEFQLDNLPELSEFFNLFRFNQPLCFCGRLPVCLLPRLPLHGQAGKPSEHRAYLCPADQPGQYFNQLFRFPGFGASHL